MSTEYGYARVSSREQNEDRQLISMQDAGIKSDHIYVDKQSGKDFKRPQYAEKGCYVGSNVIKLRFIPPILTLNAFSNSQKLFT